MLMGIRLSFLLFSLLFALQLQAGVNFTHAIYGIDDRVLITKKSQPHIQKLGSGVALIISEEALQKKWINYQVNAQTLQDFVGLCSDEKHSQLPSLNNCTGFLIGEDLLLSAGHCFIDQDDCKNQKIVFDATRDHVNNKGYKISKKSVYSCKEILINSVDPQLDFSLIRLNEKIVQRHIFKLPSKELSLEESFYGYMIGHPLGLPLMKTSVEILNSSEDGMNFKTALDSFLGNSGSPVIHAESQHVLGILVNGNEDFELDEINNCQRYKRYETQGNEGVLSIQKILPLVKSYLSN